MAELPLYLAEDVFFCITQGHGVFLDLKRDKYSAVLFSDIGAPQAPGQALAERLAEHSEPLLAAGLLTTERAKGRPLNARAGEPIEGHIFGLDDQRAFGLTGQAAEGLHITFGEAARFFLASWRASYLLKHLHIAEVVIEVRPRKARAGNGDGDGNGEADIDKVRRLTAVFRRLRPWYPRKYLCLYDSLALVEFLASYKIHPLWIFAVQAQPFGAHCWVQKERLLLNEGSEYAGQFTPIMAV